MRLAVREPWLRMRPLQSARRALCSCSARAVSASARWHSGAYPALPPNVRVIPPQPFAPSGKGRLARVPQRSPIARLASAASASRSGPFRSGASACGGGIPRGWRWRVRAFLGRPRLPPRLASGLGRPPHPPDAGHPASAEYRLRGLSSPRRRGWPSGRPAVREPLGRASAPVPPSALLALACLSSTMQPRDGCIYPAAQPL